MSLRVLLRCPKEKFPSSSTHHRGSCVEAVQCLPSIFGLQWWSATQRRSDVRFGVWDRKIRLETGWQVAEFGNSGTSQSKRVRRSISIHNPGHSTFRRDRRMAKEESGHIRGSEITSSLRDNRPFRRGRLSRNRSLQEQSNEMPTGRRRK